MYVILYNLTALQTFYCLLPVMWAQNNTCNSSYVGVFGRSRCFSQMLGAEGTSEGRGVAQAVVGAEVGGQQQQQQQPGSQRGSVRDSSSAGCRCAQGEGSKPGHQLWAECPRQRCLFVVSVRMWAGRCSPCLPEKPVMLVCVFSASRGGGAAESVPGEATSLVASGPSTETKCSYKTSQPVWHERELVCMCNLVAEFTQHLISHWKATLIL